MKRLSTDRSIAPLVAQFVPLKIATDNPQSWTAWARKYPPDGRGIPIIYVIRADGQKLYGKTGSLSGPALPQMMQAALSQSGRIFSDQQIAKLESAVSEAKKAKEAGDPAAAIRALASTSKLGPLGNLGSAAESALEADQLVKRLTEEATAALDKAVAQLAESQQPTQAAIAYVKVTSDYAQLAEMKKPLAEAARAVAKQSDVADVLQQAEYFLRAKSNAEDPRTKQKGIAALERVASQTANREIAELALTELRQLLGDDFELDQTSTSTESSASRTWTDATGKFQVDAVYKGVKDGKVVLQKTDGRIIQVPLEVLSERDRSFVAEQ